MTSIDWFIDARFGMFIHWGLYSNPGGVWKGRRITHNYSEWLQASEHIPRTEYRELAKLFNPSDFSADEWIQEARNAGMRYFLITAKHHDGFALWPTKASSFNVVDATPFKRDILGELAEACRRYDIKLGFYYSHWQDWEGTGGDICTVHMENEEYVHPSQEEFEDYWQNKCLVQVRELIEHYDPSLLWFDSWDDYQGKNRDFTSGYLTPERQDQLISLIRELSDTCLVNSRIHYDAPSERVDYLSMMDNIFPSEGFDKPWETSGTLNESWAYHSMDFGWKPTRQLLQNLIGNASLGGNYQLNVGPMPDGRFQAAAIKRLREMGAWLSTNGESIYDTEKSPLEPMPWGRITSRQLPDGRTRLYLHLYEFTPGKGVLINGLDASAPCAAVLETGQPIPTTPSKDGLWIGTPKELRGCDLPVVVLDVDGEAFA
jgi:alpha-L-fucosidase